MKIKLEFDLTPKEFRQSLGLPGMRVQHDIKNFDATKLFNAWVSQGLETSVQLQKFLSKAVGTALRGRPAEAPEAEEKPRRSTKKG